MRDWTYYTIQWVHNEILDILHYVVGLWVHNERLDTLDCQGLGATSSFSMGQPNSQSGRKTRLFLMFLPNFAFLNILYFNGYWFYFEVHEQPV